MSTRIVVTRHTSRLSHQGAVMAVLNSRQHQCNVNAGRTLHPRPLLGGQGTVVWDARWLWYPKVHAPTSSAQPSAVPPGKVPAPSLETEPTQSAILSL